MSVSQPEHHTAYFQSGPYWQYFLLFYSTWWRNSLLYPIRELKPFLHLLSEIHQSILVLDNTISFIIKEFAIPLSSVWKKNCSTRFGSYVMLSDCLDARITFYRISKEQMTNWYLLSSESWDIDVSSLRKSEDLHLFHLFK